MAKAELVVCDHAKTAECPLSVSRCWHKRPHRHDGNECAPNECQTTLREDGSWNCIRVKCVAHNVKAEGLR